MLLIVVKNVVLGGYTGTYSDQVYEWDGEEEEWTLNGNILNGRFYTGLSLVPLSSGVMDYCSTSRDVKDQETVVDSPIPDIPDMENLIGA